MHLPRYKAAEEYSISPEGFQKLLENTKVTKYSGQDVIWTSDIRKELPVRLGKEGISAERPATLIEEFRRAAVEYKDR